MEVYKQGRARYNTEHFRTYAEIHDMAEKPGFLAKEIKLSTSGYKTLGELKSHVNTATQYLEKYLNNFLPNYFYTFKEPGEGKEPAVIFFMEEVMEDRTLPPAKDIDQFLKQCCEMYKATRESGHSFMTDMKRDNLIFGHTNNDPQARTYFIDLYPTYFDVKPGYFHMKASEFAKIYGPNNLPSTGKIINTIH